MDFTKFPKFWFFFFVQGCKSKGVKSKGRHKSKGFKAFKGTKAKSYIHKGLTKRSAEPGFGWSLSRGFYWKCHSWKGKCKKGKCVEFLRLLKNCQQMSLM